LLKITGTGATDNVSVRVDAQPYIFGTTLYSLVVQDNGTDQAVYQDLNLGINNIPIQFSDGGGSDTFVNNTNLPCVMTAGDFISDNYIGGTGPNTFIMNGVYGSDVFLGRGDSNTVIDHVGVWDRTSVLTDTALTTSGLTFGINRQNTTTLGDIQHVEIDGGGYNEVIDARGFSGSTILRGGGGGGTIYGGQGNDDITTSWGGYVVFDTIGQNTFHTQTGDQLYGLANRRLSDAELSQTGALMVSRQGGDLVFNGPTGGGFRIGGTWDVGADSLGGKTFTATSTLVTVRSALGDIPLPNLPSSPLTIVTKPSNVPNAGVYDTMYSLNQFNIAPLGTASQSSTAFGGDPARAIDNNTDGNYWDGSVTHTDNLPNSWWQVQLPTSTPIQHITLFNRADCCGTRLSNFTVTVYLHNPLGGDFVTYQQSFFQTGSVDQGGSFDIQLPNFTLGDRVRVQLNGYNNEGSGYLSLAEVQVFAPMPGLYSPLSNLTDQLSSFLTTFGVKLTGPGFQFGIGLGGDLTDNLHLPLANALPYIYVGAGAGFSLEYGNARIDTAGKFLSFALDPADPSLFLKVGDFAFGGSWNGYIPFRPLSVPSALASTVTLYNGVAGYGNLYAKGAFDLGEIPITLGGEAVIGFDANHTGSPLGITGDTAHELTTGQLNFSDVVGTALNNLFVGFNGTVGLGYDKAGFHFYIQAGQGTVIYKPGILAEHSETLDPFQGTFLENTLQAGFDPRVGQAVVSVDAYVRNLTDFSYDLSMTGSVLFGQIRGNGHFHFGNDGLGIDFMANSPIGNSSLELTGNIYYDGTVRLTGGLDFNLNAYVATIYCHADFTFGGSVYQGFGFVAHVSGGVSLGVSGYNLHAGFYANLSFALSANGSYYLHGNAGAWGGVTFAGYSWDVGVGIDFDNYGLTLHAPWPFGDISANW
jgi:hypothetical protein